VRTDALGIPLISSCVIHITVIMLALMILHNRNLRHQDFLPIGLVQTPPEVKKPSPLPKVVKPQETKPVVENEPTRLERPALSPATAVEEPAKTEAVPNFSSSARVEGGGSEAGTENLFGKGDAAVVPGSGTAGGGGGTAASGLGRGSGVPGLPMTALRANREAKPIQTVRASYPPMALRMGLEGDVVLKIQIDPEGKVMKIDLVKAAGMGFDEEALKAVKQSRFEPAQRDGKNLPAEFTYIYRFRLQK